MFFTIYKITNLINSKYYIGKHQTKKLNDGYMGSGKLIKRAIQKYGLENFRKEILFVFDNEKEMNYKEKELVIISEDTYNLCPGGKGGFGYINQNILDLNTRKKNGSLGAYKTQSLIHTPEYKNSKAKRAETFSKNMKNKWKNGYEGFIPSTKGLKFNEETRKKMSKKSKESNNSQYGTIWITDGTNNKKIKKDEFIPEGWYKGRKIK